MVINELKQTIEQTVDRSTAHMKQTEHIRGSLFPESKTVFPNPLKRITTASASAHVDGSIDYPHYNAAPYPAVEDSHFMSREPP